MSIRDRNIRRKNIRVVAPILDEPSEVSREVLARLVLAARADKKYGDAECLDWDGLGTKAPTPAELTAAIARTGYRGTIVELHKAKLWWFYAKSKPDADCLEDETKYIHKRMEQKAANPLIADL